MHPAKHYFITTLRLSISRLATAVLLFVSASDAHATRASFENFWISDGIPGKTVWASNEDSLGFLWVAGEDGIARFDGDRFTRFPFPETQGSFPEDIVIRDFAITPDDIIWAGTLRHGAFRIVPYGQSSSIEPLQTEGMRVRSVVETKGEIFAGTSAGLEVWDPTLSRFRLANPDFQVDANEVYILSEEVLLVGTAKGVYSYGRSSGRVTPIAAELLGAHFILDIMQTGDDKFLAGTLKGVAQFSIDGSSGGFVDWVQQSTAVFAIASYAGEHWLGTRDEGLIHVRSGGVIERFAHDPRLPGSISDSAVTSVEFDRSGSLWAGTFSGGIDRLDPMTLRFGRHDASSPGFDCLNESVVHAFLETSDAYWLGTADGLARFEVPTGRCSAVETDNVGVLGIIQTGAGEIWAATSHGPAKVAEDPGGYALTTPLIDQITYFVTEAQDNSLIFGSDRGLIRVQTSTEFTEIIPLDTNDRQPGVYGIAHGDGNRYWLGTSSGLYQWDSSGAASAVAIPGVEKDSRVKVLFAAGSSIWLGLSDIGLLEMDPHSHQAEVRIPASDIGEILGIAGDRNFLWITTTNGLVRFNTNDNTATRYGPRDGLQSEVFTLGAVMKDSHGRIHLGGRRGWNVFDPKDIQPNLVPPKVALTGLTLFNEPVPIGSSDDDSFSLPSSMELLDSLSLTHSQDTIGIEFAALHFADPSRNTIEFRLDGFEDKWSTARAGQRVATYTSLPWGNYTFRVRAANKDGIWGEEATLPITIITPVWARWWAIGVYIAFAFVLAWAYAQYRSAAANRRAEQLEATVNERTRELAERNQRVEEQKATIEHLLSRKNSLFANVSHEFRTPLTLILGPLDQLIEKAKNSSEQKPMFQRLRRNANRLLNLVDQLLFLARTTGSHYQIRETLRLDECVEYLVSSFQPLAEEKSLQLTTTKCHAASVLANKDAVESMVSNLLSNAIKYTPAGGQIMVSLERLSDTVKLSVSDTGRGLSISEQATIFERFTRLDEDRSVEGTGIGLALVRELAEAHEGDIEVESVIGEGTTFTLVLPLTAAATPVQERIEAPKPDHEAPRSSASRKNVLIIDDDRDMLEYVAECLEQDFHCTVASNGREGLELALELVPDVIVSDVMMPEVDGYEFSRAVREDERLSHIPIILLSARGSRKSRIEGWNAYADDYLVKPFDHNELRARIHNLLKVRELLRTKVHGELVEHGKPTGLNKKEQAFVDRLDTILERRFSEIGLSRTDLASDMAVSDRQLQRKLKALIDQNPSDYLREFRLRKAKELLLQGEQVALAAEYCGFASPSQFGQAFKQRFGVTPKKFQTER